MEELKNSNAKKQNSFIHNLLFIYGIVRQDQTLFIPAWFLLSVLQATLPILLIYFAKVTIDYLSLPMRDAQAIVQFVGYFIIIVWLLRIIINALEKWIAMYANQNRHRLLQMIENKVLTMDYINLENPEVQRARRKAIQAINSNLSGGEAVFANLGLLLQHAIGLLFYSLFLTSLNIPIFLALTGSTLFITFLTQKVQSWERESKKQENRLEQRLSYARERLIKYETAKDIRLFSLSCWFTEYLHANTKLIMLVRKKVATKFFRVEVIGDLLGFLRDGIAYAFLIKQVLDGTLTVGEFTFYLACITGFSHWLGYLGKDLSLIHKSNIEIGYLLDFLNIPERKIASTNKNVVLGKHQPPEIVFDDVSFRYPNSSDWTIKNLNLTIRPGEKLSIVGLNGAGKSTLVKMLCGLYPPTNGRILADSVDVSTLDKKVYFDFFSAVFQENRVLAFDVQQNIALCPREEIDQDKLKSSLSKAGLLHTVESLIEGLDTPLTRLFDSNGVILSGGQLQKLLLARALYKDAPIVVLDEPTAAMDPLAEAELYNQFSQLVEGKTAVFISHRLASTRFCDRIILMKEGLVEEDGSHDVLLKRNGEYARLFHIQAKNYQQSSVEVIQC